MPRDVCGFGTRWYVVQEWRQQHMTHYHQLGSNIYGPLNDRTTAERIMPTLAKRYGANFYPRRDIEEIWTIRHLLVDVTEETPSPYIAMYVLGTGDEQQ